MTSEPPTWPLPPESEPGGLEDGACPKLDDHVLALVYRLQAQLEQHRIDFGEWRQVSTADRADLRRLLEAHTRDEKPRLGAIQTRINVVSALMISVALFALAGPDGLRRIGDVVTRGGTLGVDGVVTLAGAAIPLLYPLGRLLFLRLNGDERKP
jgi:hypothetical protein